MAESGYDINITDFHQMYKFGRAGKPDKGKSDGRKSDGRPNLRGGNRTSAQARGALSVRWERSDGEGRLRSDGKVRLRSGGKSGLPEVDLGVVADIQAP